MPEPTTKPALSPEPKAKPLSPQMQAIFRPGHSFTVTLTVTEEADMAHLLKCADATEDQKEEGEFMFHGFQVQAVFTSDVSGAAAELRNFRRKLFSLLGVEL